jgi:hypothetical protein
MIANVCGGPMIWPLRAKLAVVNPTWQKRPRSTGGLPIPMPPILPWDFADAPTEPPVVHQLMPSSAPYNFRIAGLTLDSFGALLANCVVHLFYTATDILRAATTSDGNGFYEFRAIGGGVEFHYVVAYKAGSPDVAGTTINTLVGR